MESLPKIPKSDKSISGDKNKKFRQIDPKNNNPTYKRAKLYNSRQIRTQIQDDSFTNPPKGGSTAQKVRKLLNNGSMIPNKLNIPEYLASREFEIKALDSAMIKSKTSGASRVFQSLPRTLRRRTASHNVRRIPKRMRRKALREMGLQIKFGSNQNKEALGTKGVTLSGKPIKPKLGRGRARWVLIRKIKLLKYAAKWKLKGRLSHTDWVSLSQLNLRKKLKLLKNNLKSLEDNNNSSINLLHNNQSVRKDIKLISDLTNSIHNRLGSYDNTSVNQLSKIHKITTVQYITRQKHFKWLPTHIWHAKRAKMIKRWEWTIPNEPTQRCYRSISRASRIKGAVISDTSYFGSLVLNIENELNTELVLNYISKITKSLIDYKKCILKGISWEGYIYDITDLSNPIGRVTFVFIRDNTTNMLRILARLHPSIYQIVYNQLVKAFNDIEGITIHDCKYSIGSISLTGPKSLTALQSVLQNHNNTDNKESDEQFKTFMNLYKLNDLTTIPDNVVFTFNVCDPRFKTKPVLPTKPKLDYNEQLDILITLKNKKSNKLNASILKPDCRAKSYDNQMSLKELGKRRAYHPGETIPLKNDDASICVMLLKSYEEWTLILPWFWVLPFWHSFVHIPHIQIGGFKQAEQLRLERSLLGWSDMVFTNNGFIQCELEREESERKWEKRPKSKRLTYSKINVDGIQGELLSPFGLDWRGLQTLRMVVKKIKNESPNNKVCKEKLNNRIIKDQKLNVIPQSIDDIPTIVKAIQSSEKQLKKEKLHSLLLNHKPIVLANSNNITELDFTKLSFNIKQLPPLGILPIYFTCVSKGNVSPNARIYELNDEYSKLWKDVSSGDLTNICGNSVRISSVFDFKEYGPKINNIIGLVSSSAFSLVEGRSAGIGFVDAQSIEKDNGYFLVRNVASTTYVLINWRLVDLTK